MTDTMKKSLTPVLLSWTILSTFIIVAQLFNEPYQYALAACAMAIFIGELYFLTAGKIIESNGYIHNISAWGYVWRTITALFVNAVFVVTLAMIFFPGEFIYYRLTTLAIILLSTAISIFIMYRNALSKQHRQKPIIKMPH